MELPQNPTDKLVQDALNKEEPKTEQQTIFKAFQDNLNQFIKKINTFQGSKSQLQRVLTNLAISPLNSEELHHGYVEEKELFDLANELNSAKFYLMLEGLREQGKIIVIEPTKDLTEEEEKVAEELNKMETVNANE